MLCSLTLLLLVKGITLATSLTNRCIVYDRKRGSSAFHSFAMLDINTANYPTTIKNVISKLTASTQAALRQGKSRIEIDLPPGVDFGLELSRKREGKLAINANAAEKISRSNRDAARLVLEMFSSISTTTSALFPTSDEARSARDTWAPLYRGHVLSIDNPVLKGMGKSPRSRRVSAVEHEQALLGSGGIFIPEGTEVIVVVGPRERDFQKILTLHEQLGDGTLIVLLNARVDVALKADSDLSNRVRDTFVPGFHYAPPAGLSSADAGARELLLFHEFGKRWYLAEKAKSMESVGGMLGSLGAAIDGLSGGGFTTLLASDERPTPVQISAALGRDSS